MALIGLREQAYKEIERGEESDDDLGENRSSLEYLKKQQEVLKNSGRYKM